MSCSKFQRSKKARGGMYNVKSFFDKKSECLSESSVRKLLLQMECGCPESCTWKIVNNLDNACDFVMQMRRDRFAGKTLPLNECVVSPGSM